MIKNHFYDIVLKAVREAFSEVDTEALRIDILKPRKPEWGDISTNAPMIMSKVMKIPPKEAANLLILRLNEINDSLNNSFASKIEFAEPGFVNIFFSRKFIIKILRVILKEREGFGVCSEKKGLGYLIEYVSANPTGPLHIGHGRGAVFGDVISKILISQGYDVLREFYVNDAGAQVKNLVVSVIERMKEIEGKGEALIPDDGYKGEYVKEIAKELILREGISYEMVDKEFDKIRDFSIGYMLTKIKKTLADLGVKFDSFYFEKSLFDKGLVERCIQDFERESKVFEKDGALFLKIDSAEGDKDRVLRKSDGHYTYFASDIAYHKDKFEREGGRYKKLINVWGADHHGYIPRMRSAIRLLGYDPDSFIVVLVQMVKVLKSGKPIKMSKREGDFVTLDEIIREVGKDATRYTFLMRKSDAQLEFDIDILKSHSLNNPVYYAQYGYARICSILRRASECGIKIDEIVSPEDEFDGLRLQEELDLIKKMGEYPDLLDTIAKSLEPHLLVYYIQELQSMFHQYYTKYKKTEKVLSDDPLKMKGRLALVLALKNVLKNAFDLMGIDAPERMSLKGEEDEE
ncbi:MAG: arginine--tRNA ligase [Deltaproteobacteria bacterium]|nr:arginine--tRNA ligase [Deltaproteobacteria bacterium]